MSMHNVCLSCVCLCLCLSLSLFSAGFEPHGNMTTAHHILLYGCEEPGDTRKVWYVYSTRSASNPENLCIVSCLEWESRVYTWTVNLGMYIVPTALSLKPNKVDVVYRNCGEMESTGEDYQQGPVCQEGSKILYAWAMNAPKLTLPEGKTTYSFIHVVSIQFTHVV